MKKYNSTTETFYFDRNIKGDVIALYNSAGTKVANYIYDAWGNCTTKTIVVNNFSAYNPIRYRGYYYDRETKLYYLNAKYYNPEWRRFISPDDTAYLGPDTPSGLNLYAYCNNDPVNYSDPSGHSIVLSTGALILIAFGVSAAVGATASIINQLSSPDFEKINPWLVLWDAGIAGIGGALSMSTLGVPGMILANTGLAFIGAVGSHLIQGHNLFGKNCGEYWLDIGISTAIGLAIGIFGGSGSQHNVKINTINNNYTEVLKEYAEIQAKAISGYYKTAGMAKIHMNRATIKLQAATFLYMSEYVKIIFALNKSIAIASLITLSTSWRSVLINFDN